MPGDTIPISVVVGAHELDPGLEVTVTVDGDPIALDELGNGVFEASVTPGEEGKLDLLASLTATLKSKVGLAKDRATAPYSDQVSLGLLVGFREVDFHLTSKFADPRLCPGDSLDLKGWATPRHDPSTVDRIEETSLRLVVDGPGHPMEPPAQLVRGGGEVSFHHKLVLPDNGEYSVRSEGLLFRRSEDLTSRVNLNIAHPEVLEFKVSPVRVELSPSPETPVPGEEVTLTASFECGGQEYEVLNDWFKLAISGPNGELEPV